jgi:3-dehydroquinate synthase
VDRWGSFAKLATTLPDDTLIVLDRRVGRLHPAVGKALRGRRVVTVDAGERAKTMGIVERVMQAAAGLSRSGTLVAVGGGTIGDVATVAAHLIKRGVRLVQVPTTTLAAVDSSLGGKGAVHIRVGGRWLKNAAGVFHYPTETWMCRELWETLSERDLRGGRMEAWKMVACLDAVTWRRWQKRRPALDETIRHGRALKARVCRVDPYESRGLRQVLNFGHTFGHVLESLSGFQLAHGDAVGLGILFALDVGRAVGVTPAAVAEEVEGVLSEHAGAVGRSRMRRPLARASQESVATLLAGDKKSTANGELRMVLLRRIGRAELVPVAPRLWQGLLDPWQTGARP